MLGKSTIDTNTYGKSTGHSGNYSTNYQLSGRELYMPDEVRMLDDRYALLFMRGERAIQDDKYDITQHPCIAKTTDGNAPPYRHGLAPFALNAEAILLDGEQEDFAILSEEEIPKWLKELEEKKEHEKTGKQNNEKSDDAQTA